MNRKLLKYVLVPCLILVAAGTFLLSLLLPQYLERSILPALGDQLATSLSGRVYNIGLNQSSFGDLILGDINNPALSIGSIRADYSLLSIREKRIDRLKINGFNLNLQFTDGKLVIPGIDLEKTASPQTGSGMSQDQIATNMPFQLDELQVDNGFVNILYKGQHILVPFELRINRKRQSGTAAPPVYQLKLQMLPQGQKIAVSGTVDLSGNRGIFELSAVNFDVKPFAFLMSGLPGDLDFGKALIMGNATTELSPFNLVAAEIDCKLETLHLQSVPLSFAFNQSTGNREAAAPLHLNIKSNGQQWNLSFAGVMKEPLAAAIAMDGIFTTEDEATGSGQIHFKATDPNMTLNIGNLSVIIKGSPDFGAQYSLKVEAAEEWQAEFQSIPSNDSVEIVSGQNRLKTKIPTFSAKASGSAVDSRAEITIDLTGANAKLAEAAEVILPLVKMQASYNLKKQSGQQEQIRASFNVKVPDLKIQKESITGQASIVLAGGINPQPFHDIKSLNIRGELLAESPGVTDTGNDFSIKNITTRIPWQWPLSDGMPKGGLKIADISWGNSKLGSLEALLSLNRSAFIMDGTFTHSLINGLVTSINSQTEINSPDYLTSLKIHSDLTPFSSLHVGQFVPALFNSYIGGEFGFDGDFMLNRNGLEGNIDIALQKGSFSFPEKKYAVNNINLSLQLPILPELRSAPAQKLFFDKATIGDFTFDQGKVTWQLESPDSIFIEEGVVRWAGGRIFTNAVRIAPEKEEFVVPIFCDRLKLTELLREFGITDSEGEGTVSGRIPLRIGKSTLHIEDGFLYSSPGQSGSVKVAAFDMLSTGIPKNTPQFAQVDFAAEALKNFKYNWVKLLLNSEGDDLFMQMQMDGKPVQSLPFNYNTETGLLQRTQDGTKGIDQPIRLDVNFRLPLNRFLGYSGRIQDIIDKIK